MPMKKEIREQLVAAGMPGTASDDEARKFAEDNGIKIIDTKHGETDASRAANLLALGNKFGAFEEVRKMLTEGRSNEEIYSTLLERQGAKPAGTAEIGLSTKEKGEYSLVRAINAAANKDWSKAGFEREVSDACAKHMRSTAKGFFIPMDILGHDTKVRGEEVAEVRASDLVAGTAANGGNLVATQLLMGDFIEMLRKRLVLTRLGCRYLTGLVGNIAIPKQLTGATSYFVAEDGTVTNSGATFGQISMTPKTIGATSSFSRLLTLQTSMAVEQFVRSDLALALASGLENVALNGTGINSQPTGLLVRADTNTVAIGDNGGAPTWAKIVAMETEVADDDVFDDGSMAYLFNSRTRGILKTTEKFSNTGREIWQPGMQRGEGDVNGYLAAVSNYLPKDGTKGTGEDLSTAVFGRWSDLIIGLWGVLDINVDPFTDSKKGAVQVTALQSFDTTVRYGESFCKCSDIATV